ncbi:MAG: molybdate transport system permease protein [Rubritalea sp.]|jgi:molybdate transport system permease protein
MRDSIRNSKNNSSNFGISGWFGAWLGMSLFFYLALIVLLIVADVWYVLAAYGDSPSGVAEMLDWENLWDSVKLTFLSCTVSAILAVLIAVPIGYLLSRYRFFGRSVIDAILDIPVVLPPLVIGLSLLILFNNFPPKILGWGVDSIDGYLSHIGMRITNTKLAVIVAQFTVAAAFAIRMVKATFDQIDSRSEQVAMTVGASRGRAFFDVVLPQSYRGIAAAGTLAWARALGEFGPILVFAGATKGRTEVLSTSVYLEISTGNINGAVIISLLMIALAMITILTVRVFTEKGAGYDLHR